MAVSVFLVKLEAMLVTGEIYHLLNKGVEGRNIFKTNRDYERFLLTLLECNSTDLNMKNRLRRLRSTNKNNFIFQNENPLVEIFCFCLMPNHFHIAVRQLIDGGIAKFMQRVNNSYTKYFNIKHERKGSLFMSTYKNVHVQTDSQIRHLITYIHANPLDLFESSWRSGRVKNFSKAKLFLENYYWSTYPFYTEGKYDILVSQIVQPSIVKMFYQEQKEFLDAITDWSGRYFEKDLNNLTLE